MLRQVFAQPTFLWALAVLPTLGMLAWWAARRRRWALAQFGSLFTLRTLLREQRWLQRFRGFFLLLGLMLLGAGAAGPQWGRDWEQGVAPGRDLVVALDVSRSMYAEAPSRLLRVKQG